jgi:nucleoside-diphosphate-sugar epimerase
MQHKIVVTGATGFVGKWLLPALVREGHRVIPRSSKDGDISRDGLQIAGADLGGVTHVIHLAGRAFVPDSWVSPPAFYDTNVTGTAQAAEFCRRHKAHLILASSYVYGRPRQLPIPEDHPVEAFNPYGHSKILAEQVAQYCSQTFGFPVTIIRPFNLYGPGQDRRFLIPTLVHQMLDDSPAIEVSDLRPRRDYVYVEDLVEIFLAALDHSPGIYNAGSGVSVSIGELVEMISAAAGVTKPLISREAHRPNEILDVAADVSKAARELNWSPRTPLAEGLSRIVGGLKETVRRQA